MLHALYNGLWHLARPWLWRKLRRRAQSEPRYLHAPHQRWARYTPAEHAQAAAHAGQWLWLHAVSLGEMRAARVLVETIRAAMPDVPWLITQSTATGWEEGAKLLRPGDMQVWLPWDEAGAVQRFVQTFRPVAGLLMETEIWPNLLDACQHQSVPVVLVNARINARTFSRWQRLPAVAQRAFGSLALACAQTESDAQHLRQLGAQQVCVSGNLKFDMRPDAALLEQGQRWRAQARRPIAMLASSREGEERLWIAAWQQQHSQTDVQWLIVPRHPQRFDEVAALLQEAGFTVQRRRQWGGDSPSLDVPMQAMSDEVVATDTAPHLGGSQPPVVWLGDSLGEMSLYYGMADVAIMGGSMAPLGGQNLIEACACGCPVIVGPHTFNFAQASEQALAVGAAWRCADMHDAVRQVYSLVTSQPAVQNRMVQAALDFANSHQGAAQRTLHAIQQYGLLHIP